MTQLELGDEPAPAWVPPPTTRWCLVGEAGEPDVYLLAETTRDRTAPACGLEEPDRGNYLSADPADHPPEWLSPFGIGTSVEHEGIAAYVWYLTMEADRARAVAVAARRRPRSPS